MEEASERPSRSLPGRSLLWVGLLVAIGLGVGAAVLSWHAYSTDIARREDRLAATSDLASKSLDQFFASRVALMESVARMPGMQSGDKETIRAELDAVSVGNHGFEIGVGYLDATGKAQVQSSNAEPTPLPLDLSDRDHVQEVLTTKRPTVSDVIVGRVSGQRMAVVAVPVLAKGDGSLLGMLTASVIIDNLEGSVPLIQSDEGRVRVIDGSGNVVLEDGRGVRRPVMNPAALTGDPERYDVIETAGSDDTTTVRGPGVLGFPDRLTSSSPVPSTGWTVAVDASASALSDEARSNLIQQLLVIAVLTAIGVAAVLFAIRRARSAHSKMARATRTLGALEGLSAATTQAQDQTAVAAAALAIFADVFQPAAMLIGLADEDRSRLKVMAHQGFSDEAVERFRHFSLDRKSLVTEAYRTPGTHLMSVEEYDRRFTSIATAFRQPATTGALARRFSAPRASGAVSLALSESFPPSPDDIELFEVMVSLLGEAFGRAASAEIERSVSATFQSALQPKVDLPLGLPVHCAARYVPAQDVASVGGDWFDTFVRDDGCVVVVVGDVVGQGVEAAAVMGQIRSAARAFATTSSTPGEALDRLDAFSAHISGAFGATLVLGFVGAEPGHLTIASAGHPPPLLAHGSGVRVLDEVRGTPLGFDLGHRPRNTVAIDLSSDDTLVLYTDGLVERRGEIIDVGIARLGHSIAREAHLPIQSLADSLLDRCLPDDGGVDDVALVCLRPVSDRPTTFSHIFPADLGEVRAARHNAERWLRDLDLDEELVNDIVLSISEGATNSVRHAYDRGSEVDVVVEMEVQRSTLVVTVRDAGEWRLARPGNPGGRGLGIIGRVADDVSIDRRTDGTTLRLTFDLSGGGRSTADGPRHPERDSVR